MKLGTEYHQERKACTFTVWAPHLERIEVKIVSPEERTVPMAKDGCGYWRAELKNVPTGARYFYKLNGEKERPDPASRFQPEGVHGPSEIIDQARFPWNDGDWKGLPLEGYIIYELHVGTFTNAGTFEAIIPLLPHLKDLGIIALELMPVAQFPGTRNWGYDGVHPFAVQNSYGGPEGLKRLVNACHAQGLAVVLDVVYNHLGPEGNYLADFGPYFTDRYRTPWGDAVNFDGPYSDGVRRYFIENALSWIADYHIDALRLDAVHGIFDFSARHILEELGEAVRARAAELGRAVQVIPESDLNDARVIRPVKLGGHGLDAQWSDDLHHALHALITQERGGYYEDFGELAHLEKALRESFVYSGEYSAHRKRRHGNSARDRPGSQFVVFSQNHDQVGNRREGERLSSLASFEQLKLIAGVVLLAPFIPLLFMGEEYGETAPFQYFVSHSDPDLAEAVRKGRAREFRAFGWEGEVPDPQAEETFQRSKIDLDLRHLSQHRILLDFYKTLIRFRRELEPLRHLNKDDMEVKSFRSEKALFLRRWHKTDEIFSLYNFSDEPQVIMISPPKGSWGKMLDSSELRWSGTGSAPEASFEAGEAARALRMNPHSFVLYRLADNH